VIDFLKTYYENDEKHIVEEFTKEYEGCITRVNRKMKTDLIKMDFANVSMKVGLGFSY